MGVEEKLRRIFKMKLIKSNKRERFQLPIKMEILLDLFFWHIAEYTFQLKRHEHAVHEKNQQMSQSSD